MKKILITFFLIFFAHQKFAFSNYKEIIIKIPNKNPDAEILIKHDYIHGSSSFNQVSRTLYNFSDARNDLIKYKFDTSGYCNVFLTVYILQKFKTYDLKTKSWGLEKKSEIRPIWLWDGNSYKQLEFDYFSLPEITYIDLLDTEDGYVAVAGVKQ